MTGQTTAAHVRQHNTKRLQLFLYNYAWFINWAADPEVSKWKESKPCLSKTLMDQQNIDCGVGLVGCLAWLQFPMQTSNVEDCNMENELKI